MSLTTRSFWGWMLASILCWLAIGFVVWVLFW
jgi:hypothetical protein